MKGASSKRSDWLATRWQATFTDAAQNDYSLYGPRSAMVFLGVDHYEHEQPGLLAAATGNPVFPLLLSVLAELMRESRRQTISRTLWIVQAVPVQKSSSPSASTSAVPSHRSAASARCRNIAIKSASQ